MMRCPDCRLPLTYGRCDRCRPTAVAQRIPASGMVDTHQVDESGPAAGETSPPVKWAECRSCGCPVSKIEPQCRCDLKADVARLGQILVLAHDELERVISGETCGCSECAPFRALALVPATERAADPQADGTGAQALPGELG